MRNIALIALAVVTIAMTACSRVTVRQGRGGCGGGECPCACETACCYIEGVIAVGGCIEYTGPAGHVTQFLSDCVGKQSAPAVYATTVAKKGKCIKGPTTGVPCVAGSTINAIKIPDDSSCSCK